MNKKRCAFPAVAAALLLVSGVAAAKRLSASARQIERGRYLVKLGGCNDCHTANYGPMNGNVPESKWLLGGGPLGYRGPWGTTYPFNLRLLLASMTENQWVRFAKHLKTRPPMPWFTLNAMHKSDLRAIYRFVRYLGPAGTLAHAYVPPDKTPNPPYIQWPMGH